LVSSAFYLPSVFQACSAEIKPAHMKTPICYFYTWEVFSNTASNFDSLPTFHTFNHFSTVQYIYLTKGHRKKTLPFLTQLSFPYIFKRLFYFTPLLLSLFLWVDFLKTQPCSDTTVFPPLYIFSCFGSSSSFF